LCFFVHFAGNEDRKIRLKKEKAAQVGCAVNGTAGSNADRSAKHNSVTSTPTYVAGLLEETQQNSRGAGDAFGVSEIGIATPLTSAPPRHLSPHSGGHRVKLLVDTGSGRITMTGEVAPEDLYCNTALRGVLQDNEEVELVGDLEEGVEIVNMTQSILLSNEDQVYYAGIKVENKEDDL